ncbi:MAG TPA: dienelactone hydrolase family protein [Pyrinomonadaceae bacterium]|jgi:predicted esterase
MLSLIFRRRSFERDARRLLTFALLLSALTAPPTRSAGESAWKNNPHDPVQSSLQNDGALPRGRLIERVALRDDATQGYALYLPSGYTPDKRWPILYCLDPLARGEVPVARFLAAAEKYGWIVAGSHNSRNGAVKTSLDATVAMWNDTRARLSIDERRIYAAGFSGGARMSVRFGYLCRGCLAGVVACGAGFPADIKPSADVPFPVYAIAGTEDFNFPELKKLDAALDKFSVPHRLALFDGAHAWPPAEACAAALEWMELQALKSGRLRRDETLIEQLWQEQKRRAHVAEEARNFYDAYRNYEAAANDFRGLRDVSGLEGQAARLRRTREVGRALDEEDGQIRRQHQLAGELVALLEQRRDPEQGAVASIAFRKAVDDLRKAARADADTGARRVARRALKQVFAQFYEGANNLIRSRENYALAVVSLEAAAELAPDDPHVLYELARAHALNRDKRKAFDALRKAIERGFKDAADLERNEAFEALRAEAEYRKLVESIGQTR